MIAALGAIATSLLGLGVTTYELKLAGQTIEVLAEVAQDRGERLEQCLDLMD